MNIILAAFISDTTQTGMGKWTGRVTEELRRLGHNVTVLFREDFPGCSRLGRWAALVFPVALTLRLLRARPKDAATVVVIHEPSGFWYGFARRFSRTRQPLVIMSHGVESKVYKDLLAAADAGWVALNPRRRLTTPLVRLWQANGSLRSADHCICLSTADALYLHDHLGISAERITRTPNGVDQVFTDLIPEVIPTHDVVFLGSWIGEKGAALLPRIWERVRAARSGARLLLVGTGAARCDVLAGFPGDARSSVDVVESFRGPQSLAHYLNSAPVFLLPSIREGSPLALLEAMSFGRAIVASRVGGVPDIVADEETGLLFDCGDCQGAASKVIRLLNDGDLRARLGVAARAASSRLTWMATAAAVEKACATALGGQRARL